MSGHYKMVCKIKGCRKVVAQCRCPGHKSVIKVVCENCKAKGWK